MVLNTLHPILALCLALFLPLTGLAKTSMACQTQQENVGLAELETRNFDMKGCIPLYRQEIGKQVVINDEHTLKSFVWNDLRLERCVEYLKGIDFTKHTLLGIEINSGWCRGGPLGLTYRTLNDEARKRYLVVVSYRSPGEPCRYSSRYDLWVLVPKLPEGYTVVFEVKANALKQ